MLNKHSKNPNNGTNDSNNSESSESCNLNDSIFWNTEPLDQGGESIVNLGNNFAERQKDKQEKQKVLYTQDLDKEDKEFIKSNNNNYYNNGYNSEEVTNFFNRSYTNEEMQRMLQGRGLDERQPNTFDLSFKDLKDEEAMSQNLKIWNNSFVEEMNVGKHTDTEIDPSDAMDINKISIKQQKLGKELNDIQKVNDLSNLLDEIKISNIVNNNQIPNIDEIDYNGVDQPYIIRKKEIGVILTDVKPKIYDITLLQNNNKELEQSFDDSVEYHSSDDF